jgi:hypothetical protein
MAQLDFQAFDADNHYYEATDAFTRHIEPEFSRRCMQWVELNGRQRLVVGGRINSFIPNPTFDPVARPGCLDEYYRGKNPEARSVKEIFGELEPINPAYRKRDERLAVMDTQGLEKAFFFPTLGVGMEEALAEDLPRCVPRLQPLDRRRLGLRVQGPDLRAALHHADRRRPGHCRARASAGSGCDGHLHALGAGCMRGSQPFARRSDLRPVLGKGQRGRNRRGVPRR